MGIEIERKFLPAGDAWRRAINTPGDKIRQGYLSSVKERMVRVRVMAPEAFLTVKGVKIGYSRPEFEYPIPIDDANWMLDHQCEKPLIEKTRYVVIHEGCAFEIDEFTGDNSGLVLIEVEMTSEDQHIHLPDWLGREVTHDPRYFNSNLVRHPGAWRRA